MTEPANAQVAHAIEQLAMFTQAIDARENGIIYDGVAHPTWEELGDVLDGREAYLKDAERTVRAMILLGWGPVYPDGVLYLHGTAASLKMLRETLCAVQNGALGPRRMEHSARVGELIAEIDRQRPLGPDGKHGDLHTPSCGCEDR